MVNKILTQKTLKERPNFMSANLQPVRGTRDIFGQEAQLFRKIENKAQSTAELFGFQEIITPIFEFSDVFHRTLGETSDVVTKETYTFTDRGGDSITLRPEGTAGIARALISGGMAQNLPLKFYYSGPMFRHERPQKGRYRQFNQIGVEVLGLETPSADIEVLALATQFLKSLGIDQSCQLEINTLGDQESRQAYRLKLVEFFNDYKTELSADSLVRLEKNPLRILDSKDPKDRQIIEKAPEFSGFLNDHSQEFFGKTLEGLKTLGISYEINKKLVRGLDYYCHTVFEFTTQQLGAQGTVLAGGRYDGLVEMMGGPKTPGVGWACGVDRLALMVESLKSLPLKNAPLIAVIAAEDIAQNEAFKWTYLFRENLLPSELIGGGGNMGKKMKRANKIGAHWALIIGGSELEKQVVTLKNLTLGEQKEVSTQDLLAHMIQEFKRASV
jgi:histidyl-tRNA synthetase